MAPSTIDVYTLTLASYADTVPTAMETLDESTIERVLSSYLYHGHLRRYLGNPSFGANQSRDWDSRSHPPGLVLDG